MHHAFHIPINTPGVKQRKKTQKRKNNVKERFKEVEFRQVNGEMFMSYKGIDLEMYIVENPFSYAKRGFERPVLPKWLMEKPITTDVPVKKMKYSNYLPHQ